MFNSAYKYIHFRPVALTSVLIKIFEKLVRSEIMKSTEGALDPMQFTYRPGGCNCNAAKHAFKHLGINGTHARLLFVDFSSAFNTIQPNILTERLLEQFNFSNNLVGWILGSLTFLLTGLKGSGLARFCLTKNTSTGSPQGCVLSPLLSILYTNACQSKCVNRARVIKYADDSVIVSLPNEKDSSHGRLLMILLLGVRSRTFS